MSLCAAIGLVIFGTLIGACGALLFKLAAKDFSLNPLKILTNWRLLLGGFLYLLSSVPFLFAIKHAEVSVLYPFVATSYIWVIMLSIAFLKEKMNTWKWMGIFFIILGVCFIGFGRSL
ncbi:MAG: EamA family transporter [Candidatus Eremiobacteraeota bacterium]|nr:EamA family transporter [Candidatus Eremiobacteraeota bacterium]